MYDRGRNAGARLSRSVKALESSYERESKLTGRLIKAKTAIVGLLVYTYAGGETSKLIDKAPEAGIPLLIGETVLVAYGAYKLYKAEV